MKQILIIGLLILGVVISGCSVQNTQGPSASNPPVSNQPASTPPTEQNTPAPSTGELGIKKDVVISNFAFSPSTITIPKGSSVIWTNDDSVGHTIVSDTGNEINSNTLSQGETYAHTFDNPGTYNYHCSIHPSMKGTVIVE